MKNICLIAALAVVLAGCSLKEDRSECPCRLFVDLSCIPDRRYPSSMISVKGTDGYVGQREVPAGEYGVLQEFRVPRTGVFLNVYHGDTGSFVPDCGFSVPVGMEFPEFYLYSCFRETGAESVSAIAELHKVFCRISIIMEADGPYPYSLTVEGRVCGYAIDGSPADGMFSFSPDFGKDGFSVCVPRQKDASLVLKIRDEDSLLREFAIGEYIVASGYDWGSPDLEDIEIRIDYAKTDVIFSVNGWEKTVSFDVTI